MDAVLWVVQWVVAVAFAIAGVAKLGQPADRLVADANMGWIDGGDAVQRARVAGGFEVLGALGLVLPGLLDVATFLTPLAGFGLAALMGLAAGTVHAPRGERQMIAINAVLGMLALVVALGRLVEPLD